MNMWFGKGINDQQSDVMPWLIFANLAPSKVNFNLKYNPIDAGQFQQSLSSCHRYVLCIP